MSAEPVAVLKTSSGVPIPLTALGLRASVEGPLHELTVEQHYHNAEGQPIEAIYTFPVPLAVVLLTLDLTIGERTYGSVVLRRREASEEYEQAIEQGQAGLLLEHCRDGLYTLNLGNLLPGETAVIRYRYAELLCPEQGRLRLTIPTAVAPRYGLRIPDFPAPHQVPVTDIAAEYPCHYTLTVRGELTAARIHSPSHALSMRQDGATLILESRSGVTLDRDLIVLLEDLHGSPPGLTARDGPGYVTLLSYVVPPAAPGDAPETPRAIKLVVDCSGSMAGASIQQARVALGAALDALRPIDRASLTRFGSSHEHVGEGLEVLTAAARRRLQAAVAATDATLGGTEMQSALDAVLALPVVAGAVADVLLVTDGEIWAIDALLERLAGARHRLFVLAVGASPVEELARKVARVTGGACEFAAPGEDMRAAVARLLARMAAPVLTVTAIDWPVTPEWVVGVGDVVFPGDTRHVFAGFAGLPSGRVQLAFKGGGDGQALVCDVAPLTSDGEQLARVAAARRLSGLEREAAAALAERYQLVSDYTSCVAVADRDAAHRATGMPVLRTVPQMMAAGWGGTAAMADRQLLGGPVSRMRARPTAAVPDSSCPAPALRRPAAPATRPIRSGSVGTVPAGSVPGAAAGIARQLARRLATGATLPSTIDELADLGVDTATLGSLRALVAGGQPEADVVAAWLAEFAQAGGAADLEPRLARRLVRAADRLLRRLVRRA